MIKVIIDEKLDSYKKPIREIIDLSFNYLGVQYEVISGLVDINVEDVLVCYSKQKPSTREITELIGLSTSTNIFFITINLELYEKIELSRLKDLKKEFHDFYILGNEPPNIEKKKGDFGNFFFYNFDLWGNLFQLANYQKDSSIPVCNMMLANFFQLVKDCVSSDEFFLIRTKLWPENQKFALCLTIEIDKLYKWKSYSKSLKSIILNLFIHPLAALREYLELNFKREEPYWLFPFLQSIPHLTYCLPASNDNFDPLEKSIADQMSALDKRLIKLETKELPTYKSFLFPPCYSEPFVCFNSRELKKSKYKQLSEAAAQTLISARINGCGYSSGGVACLGFRFSDLYDIPFSFRILKNLVELGKKSEIYFVDQNKIKSWLKVRQKIKWVVEQNSVKIISNYDIDNIVLEIVGNYEVEYHRGCNLRTEKNLLYISNIKKYSHATLTLKKFYRLNRRID